MNESGETAGDDDGGFSGWYEASWSRLVAAVTVAVGDAEVGVDCAAEAVSRLWSRWSSGTVADPGAWTYRVACNIARRRARRMQVERALLGRHRHETAVSPQEVHPELWAAVAELPRSQREALGLRYLEDLTQEQVADRLGVAPGTVARTLHEARRRLAVQLGGAEDEASGRGAATTRCAEEKS